MDTQDTEACEENGYCAHSCAGREKRFRCSWMHFLLLFLCIANLVMLVALVSWVMPIQEDVNALKLIQAEDTGYNVQDDSLFSPGDAGARRSPDPTASYFEKVANRTRRGGGRGRRKGNKRRGQKNQGNANQRSSSTEKPNKCNDCPCKEKIKDIKTRICRVCCQTRKNRHWAKKIDQQIEQLKKELTSLSQNSPGGGSTVDIQRFIQLQNQMYNARVGHFKATNDEKADCQNKYQGNYLLTTANDGLVCQWAYSHWMTIDAKKLYVLEKSGKVKVTEEGIYFIYGQLTKSDGASYASARIEVEQGGRGMVSELVVCNETAGMETVTNSISGEKVKVPTMRTCFLGTLAKLEKDSRVSLRLGNSNRPLNVFFKPSTAYLGFVKFA